MKSSLKNQRGETIVEVLVSFMLLLLFTAMFVVSLRYARAMSQKAETLRETAYAFCAGLYPTKDAAPTWSNDGAAQGMTFGSNDFTIPDVQLQSTETEAKVTQNGTETTEKYTFHRYYKAPKAAEGTAEP